MTNYINYYFEFLMPLININNMFQKVNKYDDLIYNL
jgi:hypothetical protein